MSKPLTTLGDALAAKGSDWRADLRAADIPRRPPPSSSASSRPDRGYVEQPEERRDTQPSAPQPRRRIETPTLTAPVALIRFERTTSYATESDAPPASEPQPSIPAAAPRAPEAEAAEMAMPSEDERYERVEGRRRWRDEYKAKVLAALAEGKASTPPKSQMEIGKLFGVDQSTLSKWKVERQRAERNAAIAAKRKATRAANEANGAAASEKTQLSRPQPPTSAATKPRGVRSFETVSLELAGAIAKVAELKRELRALLDE